MNYKQIIVNEILKNKKINYKIMEIINYQTAAPANFAIIKYWGKQSSEYMIPGAESLSISLPEKFGTSIYFIKDNQNSLSINDKFYDSKTPEFKKIFEFLSLFNLNSNFHLKTYNYFPTAAGLASSASCFAAIAKYIGKIYQLNKKEQSIIARLGSISAARSIYNESFVQLKLDNEFSYAMPIKSKIKKLFFAIYFVNKNKKFISSSEAMQKISLIPELYNNWIKNTELQINRMRKILKEGDIDSLFKLIIENSKILHRLIEDTQIDYDEEETKMIKNKIELLNSSNIKICFTQDAGPNLKIIAEQKETIAFYFPNLEIHEISFI